MASRKYQKIRELVEEGSLIPCTVSPGSEYRRGENGERGYWETVTVEDSDDSICYSRLKENIDWDGKIFPGLCFAPSHTTHSDYSGTSIELSNYRICETELRGKDFVRFVTGGHGTETILFCAIPFLTDSSVDSDCLDFLDGLGDYPILDEDDLSSLEIDWEIEAWENWCRSEFARGLTKKFPHLEDEIDSAPDLFPLFDQLQERSNTEWIPETIGSGSYIDVKRIVNSSTEDDIRNLILSAGKN